MLVMTPGGVKPPWTAREIRVNGRRANRYTPTTITQITRETAARPAPPRADLP